MRLKGGETMDEVAESRRGGEAVMRSSYSRDENTVSANWHDYMSLTRRWQ